MSETLEEWAEAGYKAHAASFSALARISLALPVPWAGEVDEYADIARAVEDVVDELGRYKARFGELDANLAARNTDEPPK